ncbi:MAG: Glu/Leu/Phe/Val dehydrogenase family protein [Deltaproteobacteria bacterium]|nr:Glu/Leu/Phe/Val dehydrogenase family protein [Deltaproteobacteria bacterium]
MRGREINEAVIRRGLTTLELLRAGASFRLSLRREWDEGVDFAGYARDFSVDQVPCADPIALGDEEARGVLAEAAPALGRLESLMRAGGHEMVVLRAHAGLGVRAWLHVHSSVLGRNNGYHAIRAGGIRRHEPGEREEAVLVDGLNLGRAMSFKNAAAEIPFGGCKMTVQSAPVALAPPDEPRLGFLAYCIDAGHFMTGPDMGFSPQLADVLRARFTRNILGGSRGALGPTGAPTALGCFLAIQEVARWKWGSADLGGRHAAVQGLGAVGLPLARHLVEAGMRLTVADTDPARIAAAQSELGAMEVVSPDRILSIPCDLLSPCAIGGVLDEASIDALRCEMIYGSANNQLRAFSEEEEKRLAERIAARGIVYQPDWTHNTAGVMAGFEEYAHPDDASLERILPRLERVCRDGTRSLLEEAARTGRTPTAIAYERVRERLRIP